MKKISKALAFLMVGLAVLILTFYIVGIQEIITQLMELNLMYYGVAVGLIFATISLWALRWKVFIESSGNKIGFVDILKGQFLGLAINNLTPVAKLGGEPVRAYILKKEGGIKMREGLATVLSDLTIEFIVSISLVITATLLYMIFLGPPTWIYIVLTMFLIFAAVGIAGIVGIYSERNFIIRLIEWITNKSERLKPYGERMIEGYEEFRDSFRKSLSNREAFTKASIISVLMKVTGALKYYVLFLALGYNIPIVYVIIIMGVTAMLLSIPATPGSLGILEGGVISTFTLLGVPSDIAATVVFLDRLVWFWGVTAIGGVIGGYYGISLIDSKGRENIV